MGKNRVVKDPEEVEKSPVKQAKSSDSTAAGAGPSQSDQAQQSGMLGALNSISLILKSGFESLKEKVGSLDENMSKRFDALEASGGEETDHEGEAAVEPPPKRRKVAAHDLSDGESEEPQSEVLAETLEVIETDTSFGPPVSNQLAEFVKKAYAKPLTEEVAKKLSENLLVPKNIDCMGVSRMNEPIYIKVPTNVKNKDRAVQDNQVMFMKVVTGLVKIADVLSVHEKENQWVKDTLKIATQAITLSASVQTEWVKQRREDVKPSLPDDFKRLANVVVPLTSKNLFGDDLEGSIKSVENTNKIAKRMETPKPKPATQNKSSKWANKKKKKYDNDYKNKNKKGKKDFQKKGSKN